MRALYPGAYFLRRHEYRDWPIDVVSYDELSWVAMCFPPGQLDGHRLAPFDTVKLALAAAKIYIDNEIENATVEPPAAKKRGTKRPSRKKKKKAAA